MSIKDIFTIWGQNTRQRTQKALERADFEMRQLNLTEQARIDRLMKLVDMKQKRLRSLRSERSKLKSAYEKKHGPKEASAKLSRLYGNFAKFADILSSVDYNKVKGFMDFSEDYDKKFDRQDAHQASFIDFQTLFSAEYPDLAGYNEGELQSWLSGQTKALGNLNRTIDTKGGGSAPVNQELVSNIVDDLYDKIEVSGGENVLKKDVIQKIFIDNTSVTELMDAPEKEKKKVDEMKTAWKKDERHIGVPWRTLKAYKWAYNDLKTARDAAPTEAQVVLDQELENIPNLIGELSKTEAELEKAVMTPYDYGAVQKRAGEILLAQESVQKIKDVPDEEVEYLQSLPEAFKYADEESLARHGKMGTYVDTVMRTMQTPKDRLPWTELLAGVKEAAREDENLYRIGTSMMASRLVRSAKAAQGFKEKRDKVANDLAVELITPVPVPAPDKLSPKVKPGTVLKVKPKWKYGYKVTGYDSQGQPEFAYMFKGEDKGALNKGQQEEAMKLWKAQQ